VGESSIDINFNFYSDAGGGDPDSSSPTLRQYHKSLWSKSELGEFYFGSDAITHSYRNHKRKKWLTTQITDEVDKLFNAGSTIGGYIIYPNNRIDGQHTINQARGVYRLIDDRFDLTLECIKRFYMGQKSPLYDTLFRYKSFFDLFQDFTGYIDFFLLQDLVGVNQDIKFYLPFDDFKTPPKFTRIADYLDYQKRVLDFIYLRNERINKS
jgi:hypothetical protein